MLHGIVTNVPMLHGIVTNVPMLHGIVTNVPMLHGIVTNVPMLHGTVTHKSKYSFHFYIFCHGRGYFYLTRFDRFEFVTELLTNIKLLWHRRAVQS